MNLLTILIVLSSAHTNVHKKHIDLFVCIDGMSFVKQPNGKYEQIKDAQNKPKTCKIDMSGGSDCKPLKGRSF